MSKLDKILASAGANIDESMGAAVRGVPAAGPRPPSVRHQGVRRKGDVAAIPLEKIRRDEHQPREEFDHEALERLAGSLRSRGQLQPVRVRWDEGQGAYILICGERRWRAAAMAGLETLDCVMVEGELPPAELLAVQLVENALREDLSPLESARAYKQLMEAQGWSVRQLATELGIAHPTVLRHLALLELPAAVQEQVEQGTLAPTVAAELAKLEPEHQVEAAQAVVAGGLNRGEVSELVQAIRAKRPAPAAKPEPVVLDLGDGMALKLSWKKANGVDLIKALKIALRLAQDQARGDQAA